MSVTTRRVTGQGDIYWEDLSLGQRIIGPGVTMTDSHLVSWAGLTGDWVSLHLDAQYAAALPFGERIAHGPLTMSLSLGLLTQTGIFGNVSAWLGVDKVRAVKPVLIGDTVHPEAELVVTRETKRPAVGIWTFDYQTLNQHDEVVMTFSGSFMVTRRSTREHDLAAASTKNGTHI